MRGAEGERKEGVRGRKGESEREVRGEGVTVTLGLNTNTRQFAYTTQQWNATHRLK